MRLILSLALSIPVALAGRTPPSAPAEAASSKVWVGHYGEYERFLRTAVIDRARGTTQRVFFTPGGLAESGAVHRQDYKGEIAGYKFDRVLNLDMVPPTVEKNVDGVAASLALWVLNTRPLRRIDEGGAGSSDPARWNYQLHRAYAFEDLVANLDVEYEASPLIDPQGNLILLDHSEAFTTTLAQPFEIGTKLNQIDRLFFTRIKALNNRTVTRAIGDLVDARAIDALFTRRDAMVNPRHQGRDHGPASHSATANLRPAGTVSVRMRRAHRMARRHHRSPMLAVCAAGIRPAQIRSHGRWREPGNRDQGDGCLA